MKLIYSQLDILLVCITEVTTKYHSVFLW